MNVCRRARHPGKAVGGTFPEAQARADWTQAHVESLPSTTTAPAFPPGTTAQTRYTQFFQGAFTTSSGQRGTFTGPWTPVLSHNSHAV